MMAAGGELYLCRAFEDIRGSCSVDAPLGESLERSLIDFESRGQPIYRHYTGARGRVGEAPNPDVYSAIINLLHMAPI